MFHISSLIEPFSYGKVNDVFWGIRIKFHLEGKKDGKRGVWGERSKVTVIFAKLPLLSEIQTFISQTGGQTNFQPPPLQSACPKTL